MSKGSNSRTKDAVGEHAELLQVMGNAKQLTFLARLVETEVSVCELAGIVSLPHSALSQHLAKLRGSDLVSTRKVGHMVYYSYDSPKVRKLLATLRGIERDLPDSIRE